MRDQWHTMTRSGRAPQLALHSAEPQIEIHPRDAARAGLAAATIARISGTRGELLARVLIAPRQAPGSVFVPIHWSPPFGSAGHVNVAVEAVTDPLSGQPELKAMTVAVRAFPARCYGFAVGSGAAPEPSTAYRVRAAAAGGWRLEFAHDCPPQALDLGWAAPPGVDIVEECLTFEDVASGRRHSLWLHEGRLVAAVFVAPGPVAVARAWLVERLGQPLPPGERIAVLAGRPPGREADHGAVVCSCHGVGRGTIEQAVRSGCRGVAAVGKATAAGTGCGTCRGEIGEIVAALAVAEAG